MINIGEICEHKVTSGYIYIPCGKKLKESLYDIANLFTISCINSTTTRVNTTRGWITGRAVRGGVRVVAEFVTKNHYKASWHYHSSSQ